MEARPRDVIGVLGQLATAGGDTVRHGPVARREVLDPVHFKPHGQEKAKKVTEIFGIFILIMLERS